MHKHQTTARVLRPAAGADGSQPVWMQIPHGAARVIRQHAFTE